MKRALAPAGIAVLLALAYLPSLSYPYVQDAHFAVERNDVVERGRPGEIFASHYWKDTPSAAAATLYRPVTVLSFAAERKLAGGPAPGLSHALNVLLHGLAAWLLGRWLAALGARPGAATAASWLFAAHPLGLYGAVSVVGRADALALACGLAALLGFARAADGDGDGSGAAGGAWAARLGALALFAALGAKEVALAFVALLPLQELARGARPGRALAGRALWAGLAVLVWLALRTRALGVFPGLQPVPPEDNPLVGLAGVESWATALGMAGRYLALALRPLGLSADWSGTAIAVEPSPLAPLPAAGLLLLLAAAAAATAVAVGGLAAARGPGSGSGSGSGSGRGARLADVGLPAALFLASYLTVGNLLVLNAAGFAERLFYVPLAGLVAAVAALGARAAVRLPAAPRARPAALAAVALLALALAWTARVEARMWESDRALMEQAVRHVPRSMRANMALAQGHRGQGRFDLAERYFRAAVEGAPADSGSRADLGIFLAQRDRHAEAREALRRAVELDPENGAAWTWLGAVLRRTGGPTAPDAERALRKGLVLRPDLDLAREELADLLDRSGRHAEAAGHFRRLVLGGRRDLAPRLAATESRAAAAAGAPPGGAR